MTKTPQNVVIAGRDVAAWLTACALARAFAATGLRIEVVELPGLLRAQDALASLPQLEVFHGLLGLDEKELLKQTQGVYSLGQSFANFSGPRPPFFHPYGDHGVALGASSFAQIWFKARQAGLKVDFEDFSPNAAAAKAGRFFVGGETARAFGRCNYAYHLHGQAYVQALKALALRMGVKVTPARGFDAVLDPDSGLIRALALSDGRQVAGDFFIDATGGDSRLLGQAMQGAFIDWSRWLPMNRTLSAGGDRLRVLPAYSQVRALEAGCLHMTALQTMTGVTHAYSADWLSDEQALEALNVTAGIGLSGDATLSVRAPGRREHLWLGNCVAIGEAGCVLDPIDNPDLHILQIGLSHLIALFPLAVEGGVEAAQYNRLVGGAYERLRDYQIAHYGLNRQNHPFWDALRDVAPPDSLAAKLDLYKARGEVLLYEDETFQNDDWLSLFIGHGLMPDAWDPRIDMLPEDQLILHVQKLLGFIRDQVQAMDSHDAYIELFAARSFAGFGSQL